MNRFVETVRHLSLRQIATRAARILERTWRRMTTPDSPPWREPIPPDSLFLTAPEGSRLRAFQVQSFEYARDMDGEAFRQAAKSWIASHGHRVGDAWHPYPISLRIVSWCNALMAFGDDAEICASLYAQARFLTKHLEYDVRGNHLLENARALVRAGAFFHDDALLRRGVAILRDEVPEQVLVDGGHFERVPGYHVRVMEVLEDAATVVQEPWLADAIERMQMFLDAITPANGRLPLLKDTTYSLSQVRVEGRASSGPRSSRFLDASGFAVLRDDAHSDFLIADFGPVCPDYLPAHAHADMFSFELTMGGAPVIVDSGVFEYAEGKWRTWFRSTAAHNSVEVDGRDQSEMWASFRVGRRAHPRNILWTDGPSFTAISGEHDGYSPVIHRRTIVAPRDTRLWIIADRVSGPAGHTARSFVHIHPDAEVPHIAAMGATMTESEGWYSERFGEKRRNRVFVLEAASPAWFGYVVSADEQVRATLRGDGDGCVIEIASPSWSGSVRLGPPSVPPALEAR